MKSVSSLLSYLGKAGSRLNTPEDGDTRISIPGMMNPVLELIHPTFQIIDVPLPGGQNIVNSSFLYSEEITFNISSSPILLVLGPGLWDIETSLALRQAGAVSDATSNMRLALFDQSAGSSPSWVIHRITNAQGLAQAGRATFKLLAMAEQLFSFNRIAVAGLGTGLNVGHLRIRGTRLF